MSHQWNVRVSGTKKSKHNGAVRDRMIVVAFETSRENAKHAALEEAAKHGLEECSVDHIAYHGVAHTCTFAESPRGAQRREQRRYKRASTREQLET